MGASVDDGTLKSKLHGLHIHVADGVWLFVTSHDAFYDEVQGCRSATAAAVSRIPGGKR
jgi:hypothetical protein